MSDILDIRPAIRRKKAASCAHSSVSVDDSAASMTCDDCEAEIEPWWYLRRLAHDAEKQREYHDSIQAGIDATIKEGNAKIELLNAAITRLNADVARLNETKNRLWNEQIGGRPLGSIVAHPRRRTRKATP